MTNPYMSTIVNMAEIVDIDKWTTAEDGSTAGEAYISFSAST